MASINFTGRVTNVTAEKFTAELEVSGEDFEGKDYSHKFSKEVPNKLEFDVPIPGTSCEVHVSINLVEPKKVAVDGHLQCGAFRQPTSGPTFINLP